MTRHGAGLTVKRIHVLLLGFKDQHDALAGRLLLLNIRALRADDAGAGATLISRSAEPVRATLVPADLGTPDLAADLDRLRRTAGTMDFVALGPQPASERVEALRKAGVRFCLWHPIEDSALRSVVNRAVYDEGRGEVRGETRVPTAMVARIFSAAGEKAALLYNLSVGGAYLETHRPTGVGGHVKVEVPLPAGKFLLAARVVSTNVPGNLQRPNLPMGMGVAFTELDADTRAVLERYVEERSGAFEL